MIGTVQTGAAAAAVRAIRAAGGVVRVDPQDLASILARQREPLVVVSESHFLGTTYRYMTSYKGLAFCAKSAEPIPLPSQCEVVQAKKLWFPE